MPIWTLSLIHRNGGESLQLFNSSSENDPPIWPSGGAQIPQKLKNLFDPFDGVQNLKPVGEEVWFYRKLLVTYSLTLTSMS